jgi:hypothetical protein
MGGSPHRFYGGAWKRLMGGKASMAWMVVRAASADNELAGRSAVRRTTIKYSGTTLPLACTH